MEVPGRPRWVSVLSATYPVLDVLVLCALVQLSFTTRGSSWSLRFLIASISLLLTGDACYAYLSTQGTLVAPHAVDVVYSFSFLLLGASALHPSVGSLAVGRRRRLQSWSLPRVLMVVPSMTAPVVLLSLTDDRSPLLRALLAGLAVVAIGLLVTRAMVAVRALGRLQRATAHEATHDSLTGLPNRVHLDAWLARQLQRGRQLSVLFLDLDGFKLVNDSFGHAAGDELLEAVAARLRRVTPSDAVLARLGGDEFVMAQVVGGEGRAGSSAHELAGELAEAMLGAIAQPFVLSVAEVVVTGSIGVSGTAVSGSAGSSTAQDLVREADTAMYRAKASGTGVVATFDASMRGLVRERLDLEQALRQALPLEQLSVVFQPVVALPSGRVVSHEALLRWNHPTRGAVPPSTFIDLAEDAGLIVEIGEWVLLQSLEVLAQRWRAGDRHLTVAVNVAGRQLADRTLPHRVARALAHHGLPPSALKLEITESAMLQDGGDVERTMAELVANGVRLSMDDFGTGFSSLSYLRRLPVAEVKIDRSFVAGIVDSPADEEIVRAATAMAHALRLEVVAEGVETVEQRLMLQRLGVDRGQGWLFGRPVAGPAETPTSALPDAPRRAAASPSMVAPAGS
jgi:diguanylate cyclase (GGDEF)-like protein